MTPRAAQPSRAGATRRRVVEVLALVVALAALASITTWAPPAAAATDDALELVSVDTSRHPEVAIRFAVPDSLIADQLGSEDVVVTENDHERRSRLRPASTDGLTAILVIDTSGSMRGGSMEAAKAAAADFVGRLPSDAQVGVVAFGSSPVVVAPLSTDRAATTAAIATLQAGGETALFDALVLAADTVQGVVGRKEIVLLSDGGDTTSRAPVDAAVSAATGAGARLRAIELATSESDSEVLRSMADATGGDVVRADDGAALATAFDRIAARLVRHYELTYRSDATGPAQVVVRVGVEGRAASLTVDAELPSPPATPRREPTHSPAPLVIGGAAVFVALAVLAFNALLPSAPRALLAGSGRRLRAASGQSGLAAVTSRATLVADRVLERRGSVALAQSLEWAAISLRPAEFVVLVAGCAFAALAAGWLLLGPLAGLVLAGAVVVVTRVYLSNRITKRRTAFGDQLGDTLQQLTGTLRAGHGMMQALTIVAREAPSPTSEEFRRLMTEVRLGRDLSDALHAMSERVAHEDFGWVVQSIDVQREVGGDLVEVLEIVAGTVRERHRLRRQVRALSAEGRISAYVLLALPAVMAALMFLVNRSYILKLFQSAAGLGMLFAGAVLMAAGTAWLRKLIRLEL